MTGIYLITVGATGERYVGSSINVEQRYKIHMGSLRCRRHHAVKMQQAYDLHGGDSFRAEVLESCDEGDLLERERHWIEKLRPELNGGGRPSRMGPRLPAGQNLTRRHVLNISEKLDRAIQKYADYHGISSISDAIRQILFRQLKRE